MYCFDIFPVRPLAFSDMFDHEWYVDWKLHSRARRVRNLQCGGYDERRDRLSGNGHVHCHTTDT
jgi:hypothetical protein